MRAAALAAIENDRICCISHLLTDVATPIRRLPLCKKKKKPLYRVYNVRLAKALSQGILRTGRKTSWTQTPNERSRHLVSSDQNALGFLYAVVLSCPLDSTGRHAAVHKMGPVETGNCGFPTPELRQPTAEEFSPLGLRRSVS
jgi:hypothetical protein